MPRLPQPGGDEGNWGTILNDYLSQSHTTDGSLKAGTVGSSQLQADSVTSTQLADNAVTATQLAPGAVSATELSNDSITEAKLAEAVRDKLNAISAGGSTNLGVATSGSTVTVTSDTGADATIPAVTTSAAGVLSATDKTKLDSIASGAQVNTVSSVAGKTGAVTLAKSDVGLGNVDNTSDANKPISTAVLAALDTTDLNVIEVNGAYPATTNTTRRRRFIGTSTPPQGAQYARVGDVWENLTPPASGGGGSGAVTISRRVATGADDGHVSYGGFDTGPTGLPVGTNYGDTNARTFFRFTSVNIPVGATITNATLTLTRQYGDGTLSLRVRGAAADSPAAPTDAAGVMAVPLTTAQSNAWTGTKAEWDGGGTTTSPSLATVIQEIVSRPGWSANNALMLITVDNGSTSPGYFLTTSADQSLANAALLEVTYQV